MTCSASSTTRSARSAPTSRASSRRCSSAVEQAPELVTVYRGGDVTAADADALVERMRARFPTTEFELHDGGQEHYSYVLSLE